MTYGFIFLDDYNFMTYNDGDTLIFTSCNLEVDFKEPIEWLKDNCHNHQYYGNELIIICFETAETKKIERDYFLNC
jgi:hypothetical protein